MRKKYKEYHEFNKSTWFLLPLIAENNKKIDRTTYLIDDFLENTYIYPTNNGDNMLYVKYKNTPEVTEIEPYLSCEYLVDIIYSNTHTVYVYSITNYPDVEDYYCFKEGKYSQISTNHKLKICRFWDLSNDHFITRLFRKDEILWHSINKSLGCMASECKCKVTTERVLVDNRKKLLASDNQTYLSCKKFEAFKMPHQKLIELEDLPNDKKETIEL